VALLAGLVAAALLGAVGVAVMAAASPDSPPNTAPISISVPSQPADPTLGGVPADPSAIVSIPDSRTTEATEQNQDAAPTSSSQTTPTPVGPATVSELSPGDQGFGWPSTAFGTATSTRTN
jgi:hypothetical protein